MRRKGEGRKGRGEEGRREGRRRRVKGGEGLRRRRGRGLGPARNWGARNPPPRAPRPRAHPRDRQGPPPLWPRGSGDAFVSR